MDFRFFDNYPSKRMRFLRSHDTLSLFLHDIMTCMHISKKYNEIHGGSSNLTIRKQMRKYLPPPHKFRPKTLDSTDTVDFTHFKLFPTVNPRIYFCKFLTLSNQTSLQKSRIVWFNGLIYLKFPSV